MNPRTRRAALYAIGAIAILASINALAHSYAGLYDWAVHHRLGGWQAMSWPAEIDVFLAVGELALYVAYLDGWPTRQRIWPWATALIGLAVSVAGNIGHISAEPGRPVILADRLTAATSPLAAFAGLAVGLLVLKMTRQQTSKHAGPTGSRPVLVIAAGSNTDSRFREQAGPAKTWPVPGGNVPVPPRAPSANGRLLRDARTLYQEAAIRGERLSQRTLARQLRSRGHRFPNDRLQHIAREVGLTAARAA
jgi:hypothetical protein